MRQKLRIRLFEGTTSEVEAEVNEFLSQHGQGEEVVHFGYNYQGPEEGQAKIPGPGTHGVCLVLRRK